MKLWHWRDLFTDHQTGKLRETTVWTNLGKVALTVWFSYDIYDRKATVDQAVAYAGLVFLHEIGARFMNQRQQKIDKEPTP